MTATNKITNIPSVTVASSFSSTINNVVDAECTFNTMSDPTSKQHNQMLKDIDSLITCSLNNLFLMLSTNNGNNTILKEANVEFQTVATMLANRAMNDLHNDENSNSNNANNNMCTPQAPATCSFILSFAIMSHEQDALGEKMMKMRK